MVWSGFIVNERIEGLDGTVASAVIAIAAVESPAPKLVKVVMRYCQVVPFVGRVRFALVEEPETVVS
jgi:hypothetical protein